VVNQPFIQSTSRVIPFEGIQNFRDLGGYVSADGRTVKHHLFYRSAHLAHMSEKDMKNFNELNIKTIVDYRSEAEAKRLPSPIFKQMTIENIAPILDLQAVVRSVDDMSGEELIKHLKEGTMHDFYQSIIFDNEAYKRLMTIIQDRNNLPLLNHCTAGKDRTGIGSALILLALDVPEETIVQDYLLSNNHLSQIVSFMKSRLKDKLTDEELQLVEPFMSVREQYMSDVFSAIKDTYDSYDAFFTDQFGLTMDIRERLKDNYLE